MFKLATVAFASALFGQVLGHGLMASSLIRQPGNAFKTNCGEQIYYNVASDPAGNIQALNQLKSSSFNAASCNLDLCKGLQFSDVPAANIQSWTPGQVIPISIRIVAPHTGTANVSIVDTATNTMIGSPMITFSDYASTAHSSPANQTKFSVTLPDLGDKCTTPGACVLQWWWDSREVNQTYESCVDFTMSGSGSGAGSGASSGAGSGSGSGAGSGAGSGSGSGSSRTSTSAAASPTAPAQAKASPLPPAAQPAKPASGPADPASAPSGCGGNLQVREFPVNAKYARCGGFGWKRRSACPEGLTCTSYNDYYAACI